MPKESLIVNNKVVIYNFNPCNAGTITNIFQISNQNLNFDPDAIRIEQVSIVMSNPNDNLYVLNSSLTDNQPIVSWTGRTTFAFNMSELVMLRNYPSQLLFSIGMIAADGTVAGLTTQTTPTYPQGGGANPTNCFVSLTVNYLKYA
jgi:hypothetical protein